MVRDVLRFFFEKLELSKKVRTVLLTRHENGSIKSFYYEREGWRLFHLSHEGVLLYENCSFGFKKLQKSPCQ